MDLGLRNKTVLMSGSSRGIGETIARVFLEEGAKVLINGRDKKVLAETYRKFAKVYGNFVSFFNGDLTKEDKIKTCLKQILDNWREVDILVPNVGTGKSKPGLQADIKEWKRIFEINLFGAVKSVRQVAPIMKNQNEGNIIFVFSIAGLEYFGAPIAYSAAKASLLTLCKSLAFELGNYNIRINAVAPGNMKFRGGRWEEIIRDNPDVVENYIKKDVPLKKFGTPEEIADSVVFLASEKASFITGTYMIVDGGQTKSFFKMVKMDKDVLGKFDISGRVAIITGGAGLLGIKHAEAIIEAGGIPILADINRKMAEEKAKALSEKNQREANGYYVDITNRSSILVFKDKILSRYGRVDILINNAANDPKVKDSPDEKPWSRFENFPEEIWDKDIDVGLTGVFICSQVFGTEMAKKGKGVILNISSDLGVVAPDQRIYRKEVLADDLQPVKPVTYSVVKHGLIGLTK